MPPASHCYLLASATCKEKGTINLLFVARTCDVSPFIHLILKSSPTRRDEGSLFSLVGVFLSFGRDGSSTSAGEGRLHERERRW